MSLRLLTALAAAALCAVAALPPSPAQSAKRSECQRLTGVDRAPDRNVKLVKRRTGALPHPDGTPASELVGCILPRGPVHGIAERRGTENDLAEAFGYRINQVKGRIVLLATFGTEGGYGYAGRTIVVDIGSGRSYTVASSCGDKYSVCAPANSSAQAGFVTRDGRAVVAVSYQRTGDNFTTNLIARFAADGSATVLDAGDPAALPPSSLRLTGNTASWTHAGEPRSAGL